MAKHKLVLDDIFEDVDYTLIAIHCSLDDYRLAYVLNKNLGINLIRKKNDLDYDYVSASYSIYECEDESQLTTWNLVSNICRKESEALISGGSLFSNTEKEIKTHNLITELKSVDYFLKINTEGAFLKERMIIDRIQKIPQIITTYLVDATKLKSKNNLIFN